MTPVMVHGDQRASRDVMDVYIRLWNVEEEGRGSGQGRGLSDEGTRHVIGQHFRFGAQCTVDCKTYE